VSQSTSDRKQIDLAVAVCQCEESYQQSLYNSNTVCIDGGTSNTVDLSIKRCRPAPMVRKSYAEVADLWRVEFFHAASSNVDSSFF